MPRTARKISPTDIYHVIVRGVNRQTIFESDADRYRFLKTINKYKSECNFALYAYCLMSNHVHLLIKADDEPLATVMKKICGSYAQYFNTKYERVGHLFQDRFKSEPVTTDDYLLTVLRYIFQNPVKAGICGEVEAYRWSNYRDYFGKPNSDTEEILSYFSEGEAPLKGFSSFVNAPNDDICMESTEQRSNFTDERAIKLINKLCGTNTPQELQNMELPIRNKYLRQLKESGISVNRLERLTGLSSYIIYRA